MGHAGAEVQPGAKQVDGPPRSDELVQALTAERETGEFLGVQGTRVDADRTVTVEAAEAVLARTEPWLDELVSHLAPPGWGSSTPRE
jgi:hypothetical protein